MKALPPEKKALDPAYVSLDLTYSCGLGCPFCFIHGHGAHRGNGKDLDLPALERLVDSLAGRRRNFYLAGGEPSLRAGLTRLVRRIKKAGHRCCITTNAQGLSPAAALRLARAGVDELEISLHGPRELHDATVRRRGAFEKARRVCEALLALPRSARPGVSLWCTINRLNHDRLPETFRALAALRPDIVVFNQLSFVTAAEAAASRRLLGRLPGGGPRLGDTSALAAGIDAAALARGVRAVKKEGGSLVRFDPDLSGAELKAWYDPQGKPRARGFCVGQWTNLWLRPDGTVVTCQPLNVPLGSAPERGVLNVYNGPEYAAFRAALKKAGGFLPTCARCGRTSFSSSARGTRRSWLDLREER